MNDMSHRPRSQAVRSAAQAHLAALREERLARRRAARSQQVPDPDPIPSPEPEPISDQAETVVMDVPQAEPQMSQETVDDIAAFVPTEEADDTEVPVEGPVEATPEEANHASVSEEAEQPPAAEDSEAEIVPDTPHAAETDLDQLPGIGPGLISMLQSAGIASLSDMSAADPEALGAKLGLVGQLLDLDFWISEAAELQSGST